MSIRMTPALLLALAPVACVESEPVGLADPSAVFCIEAGGQFDVETEAAGERGYCVLPDGQKVDAWEFFSGNGDVGASGN